MVPTQTIYQAFINYPSISTDTRKNVKDTIFFALSGENFNGNAYAQKALEQGARFAVIDDPSYALDDRCLLVNDTVITLQEIARLHRSRNPIPLIGITGSNGKTTTKNLISAVLGSDKKVTSTKGNFNNHIGLPLTILSIDKTTEIAVVEMGANHIGEIEALCNIALPGSGIITNIGKAHLEGFGSFEGIIKAKNELFQFLKDTDGSVIVNADDELLMDLSTGIKRFTYGKLDADITARITEYSPYLAVQWEYKGKVYDLDTSLYGKYNFYNILAAISVGLNFGIPTDKINESIRLFRPEDNRSQLMRTNTNNIILDAYNANPVSMSEAILSFKEYRKDNSWLILGDMFELGDSSVKEHILIVDLLRECRFENVFLVGNVFHQLNVPDSFKTFVTTEDLIQYISENPLENANILIKGSRGMYLEKIVTYL